MERGCGLKERATRARKVSVSGGEERAERCSLPSIPPANPRNPSQLDPTGRVGAVLSASIGSVELWLKRGEGRMEGRGEGREEG